MPQRNSPERKSMLIERRTRQEIRYRHARYPDASRGGNCFSAAVIAAIPTLILICWWMT